MSIALLQPVRLRRRLWQGAIALGLFIATLGIGNFFVPAEKALDRRVLGQDFLAFYTAGTAGCALLADQAPDPLPAGVTWLHLGSFSLAVR